MSKLCTIGELASTVAGIDSNNIEKPQGSPEPIKLIRHDTANPLQGDSNFDESPLAAPTGYSNFQAQPNAFNVQHETPNAQPETPKAQPIQHETPQMQHETPNAQPNDYENAFSGGSNPVADPNIFNTGYGAQKADENTQGYSSMKNAYHEPITEWDDPKNSPFAAYHSNADNPGAGRVKLMRKEFTKVLGKYIVKAVGGYDAIVTFKEENGMLYVNDCLIAPEISTETIACAPFTMRRDLERGAYYCAFDFSLLKKFSNLREIHLQDTVQGGGLFDAFFWGDIGKNAGDFNACTKIWKQLSVFEVTGEDYLLQYASTVAATNNQVEADSEAYAEEKRKKRRKWLERGKSFGSGIAALLGVKSTADKHPLLSAIGNTPIAKALRHGGLFTGALGIVNFGLMVANPFIVLGSLFTVGAYVAHSVSESHKENPQYYANKRNGSAAGRFNNSGFNRNNSTSRALTKASSKSQVPANWQAAPNKNNNYNNFGVRANSKASSGKKR